MLVGKIQCLTPVSIPKKGSQVLWVRTVYHQP